MSNIRWLFYLILGEIYCTVTSKLSHINITNWKALYIFLFHSPLEIHRHQFIFNYSSTISGQLKWKSMAWYSKNMMIYALFYTLFFVVDICNRSDFYSFQCLVNNQQRHFQKQFCTYLYSSNFNYIRICKLYNRVKSNRISMEIDTSITYFNMEKIWALYLSTILVWE